MEVAPGIHNVITEPAPAPGVTNTYLIVGTAGAIWVDTGWDRPGQAQARIDYWRKVGSPLLEAIVVTHRHPPHWGNAPAIQKVTGAPIVSTAAEKEAIEASMAGARVGRVVEDGETLSLGNLSIEFVHAPGHTYGSLAVFLREARALFAGDNVMGTGTSVINPGEGEIALFLQTMEKFMRYDPAIIYPGQGRVITTPRARLEELVRHRTEREALIVKLLEQGPKSVEDLFALIYSGLDERLGRLAPRHPAGLFEGQADRHVARLLRIPPGGNARAADAERRGGRGVLGASRTSARPSQRRPQAHSSRWRDDRAARRALWGSLHLGAHLPRAHEVLRTHAAPDRPAAVNCSSCPALDSSVAGVTPPLAERRSPASSVGARGGSRRTRRRGRRAPSAARSGS